MYNKSLSSRNQSVSRVSGGNTYGYSLPSSRDENEIKTIYGKDPDDCKEQLYKRYGTNYRIIEAPKPEFKPGFWGLFQRERYVVRYIENPEPALSPADAFQKSRDEIIAKTTGSSSVTTAIQISQLDKRLEETQKKIDEKMNQIIQATKAESKPASISKIEELLQENEFTFEYINDITTRLRSTLTVEQLDDFDFVQKTVVDWIGESIKIAPNIPHKYPHVIILVGPTGVGKTTTIAKMAGTLIKSVNEKDEPMPVIKMITIDNMRVAAGEQLRNYCDIMGIDLFKAQTSKDVKKIFDDYKDKLDVMFIDTPGYSPNDLENIGKMTKILEVHGIHPDIYLAFSAATKARDLNSILRNYESCNYASVIITKWDETTAVGNVISVLAKKEKVVSFITDGQKVPKAIERASVVRFLTNLLDFEVDREHIDEKFPEEK